MYHDLIDRQARKFTGLPLVFHLRRELLHLSLQYVSGTIREPNGNLDMSQKVLFQSVMASRVFSSTEWPRLETICEETLERLTDHLGERYRTPGQV